MSTRALVAVATALITAGLAFGASAAPTPRAERPAPAQAVVEGQVVDWSAAARSLTIADPRVVGGSRRVQRMLRPLDEVRVAIGPRTRIVAEGDDGVRARIRAGALFAELDESAEVLSVTVGATVAPRTGRRAGAGPRVTATRIVLQLPAPGDGDGDLGDEDPGEGDGDGEPDPGEPPTDDGPPADPADG